MEKVAAGGEAVAVVPLDVLGGLGLIVSVASVVLAIVAIWLALHFYGQAKNAEKETAAALEGIRAETGVLAKISDKQLTRMTRMVQQQIAGTEKPTESIDALLSLVGKFTTGLVAASMEGRPDLETSSGNTISGHGIPNFPDTIDAPYFRDAMLGFYFVTYYYTACLNYYLQAHLPERSIYNEMEESHRVIRQILDNSAVDFHGIAGQLDAWSKVAPEYVESHRLKSVGAAGKSMASFVRTAGQLFDQQNAAATGDE